MLDNAGPRPIKRSEYISPSIAIDDVLTIKIFDDRAVVTNRMKTSSLVSLMILWCFMAAETWRWIA